LGELVKCKFLYHAHKPKILVESNIYGVLTVFHKPFLDMF
jgi:hypothetical protein